MRALWDRSGLKKCGDGRQSWAALSHVNYENSAVYRRRVNMPINLQKGQKVSLTKDNPGLSKIVVGLGWDVNAFDTGEIGRAHV